MKKLLKKEQRGVIAQLCSLDVSTLESSISPDLQKVLDNHSKVFDYAKSYYLANLFLSFANIVNISMSKYYPLLISQYYVFCVRIFTLSFLLYIGFTLVSLLMHL